MKQRFIKGLFSFGVGLLIVVLSFLPTLLLVGAGSVSPVMAEEEQEETDDPPQEDTSPPQSDFSSPGDNSFWNTPINLSGSSSDEPQDTVQTVYIFERVSGTEDWGEPILSFTNEAGDEPFAWAGSRTPEAEGKYDFKVSAVDNAGNVENSDYRTNVTYDVTPPTSDITYPQEGAKYSENTWEEEIAGTATDNLYLSDARVFVSIQRDSDGAYWDSDEGDWFEDDEVLNEADVDEDRDGGVSWEYEFDFITPDGTSEGYSVRSHARDDSGNQENTNEKHFFFTKDDVIGPDTPVPTPGAGDYAVDQQVTLSSSDESNADVNIFYTTDGSLPSQTNGTLYNGAINIDQDLTLKAIAYDNAGNASAVLTQVYGIAPVISAEASSAVTSSSATITWTTDDPATSRVIYDTLAHLELGLGPNYGYANSTVETDISPKVTNHSVVIEGLLAGTTYYYRSVSHGSPESVGQEKSFSLAVALGQGTGGTGTGTNSELSAASPAVCTDTKPGSEPILTNAVPGVNRIDLSWTEGLGPISYYLVTFATTPGAQTYGNPNIGGSGTTHYPVASLSGGISYFFRVRAGNGCAPGAFSNELSAAPLGQATSAGIPKGFAPGVLAKENSINLEANSKDETKWPLVPISLGVGLLLLAFVLRKKNSSE